MICNNTCSNYPLSLIIGSSEELSVIFSYNADLLEQAYVSDIRDQFEQVLLQITAGSADTFDDIQILTASQQTKLLYEFNDTAAAYANDKSIIDVFAEQVERTPEATAIVFEEQRLTYKELDEQSNRLSRYLQKRGVKAEMLVLICIERVLEMIIGILGILKAGGAYVPIDPEYPQERINYMLDDVGARIGLSSRESRDKLEERNIPVIAIDSDWDMIAKESAANTRYKHIALPISLCDLYLRVNGQTKRGDD